MLGDDVEEVRADIAAVSARDESLRKFCVQFRSQPLVDRIRPKRPTGCLQAVEVVERGARHGIAINGERGLKRPSRTAP
jgi:hypothetical protein